MARRAMEMACKDQGYEAGTLQKKLQKMKDDGKIEGRLYDWADLLREVGNQGAHETAAVRKQDAEDALDFAEALFDDLCVMTAKFEAFKQRKAAREAGKSGQLFPQD